MYSREDKSVKKYENIGLVHCKIYQVFELRLRNDKTFVIEYKRRARSLSSPRVQNLLTYFAVTTTRLKFKR